MKRRDFVKLISLGGTYLAVGGGGIVFNSCDSNGNGGGGSGMNLDPRSPKDFINQLFVPEDQGLYGLFHPDSPFLITPKETETEIIPGKLASTYLYEVNTGDRIFYNPIFRLRKGDAIDATLFNELDEETIIHWHGLKLDQVNDGHPNNAISPNTSYNYNYQVINRAATYWYHPHPDRLVGEQAYFGLGSFFIVEDENDDALGNALDLELGQTELPLNLQDRNFDEDGQLVFDINPMIQTIGVLGDRILVNNTIKPFLDVDTRIYRLRILNSSNSRTYRLAITKDSVKLPFNIIGNDGGLLDKPYEASEVFIGVAERVDILVDFRGHQLGDDIYLKSLEFDPMDPALIDLDFNQPSTLMNGEEFFVMKFKVTNETNYSRQIPAVLSKIVPIDTIGAGERLVTLPNPIEGTWFIDNFRFNPEQVPITVERNTTEIWTIQNGPLAMPHPIHIHAFQFQILERINSPQQVSDMAIDSQGRMPADLGWKDVVLVWPGESVKYAIRFDLDFPGEQLYLFHCHNLEHEDQGMMINYEVV